MYLVVGLGNPGREYESTRHNVGFMVIDYLADKLDFNTSRERFKGMFGEYILGGEKIIFLKPLTYMNLSGEAIIEAASFYKIPLENIIIVYDDMAIDTGKIRIRPSGSDGGHNGIKSTINHLGSKEFPRIRVGIGKAPRGVVDYVLGSFTKEENVLMEKSIKAAGESVLSIITDGVQSSMNKYNSFDASQDLE